MEKKHKKKTKQNKQMKQKNKGIIKGKYIIDKYKKMNK